MLNNIRLMTVVVLVSLVAKTPSVEAAPRSRKGKVVRREAESIGLRHNLRALGVGLWVWQVDRASCGRNECRKRGKEFHYKAMADRAVRAKVDTVYLKLHDGVETSPHYRYRLITAMRVRKRNVILWGYNYANSPKNEAEIIIRNLHLKEVNGYSFNTEAHVKGKPKNCAIMARLVRRHRDTCRGCKGKVLLYAPYAFPLLHKALPYSVFGRYCDASQPQMYWDTMGKTPARVVLRTYQQWLGLASRQKRQGRSAAIKPILPLGQLYESPRGGLLTAGEIRDFVWRTRRYASLSFWDWQHMSPMMWRSLAQVKIWRKVSPPKPRTKSHRRRRR